MTEELCETFVCIKYDWLHSNGEAKIMDTTRDIAQLFETLSSTVGRACYARIFNVSLNIEIPLFCNSFLVTFYLFPTLQKASSKSLFELRLAHEFRSRIFQLFAVDINYVLKKMNDANETARKHITEKRTRKL